jgi:hypothetical protein
MKPSMFAAPAQVSLCAGFQPPVIAELSTRCGGRRLKSAKARNRGGGWCDESAAGYGDFATAGASRRSARRERGNWFAASL